MLFFHAAMRSSTSCDNKLNIRAKKINKSNSKLERVHSALMDRVNKIVPEKTETRETDQSKENIITPRNGTNAEKTNNISTPNGTSFPKRDASTIKRKRRASILFENLAAFEMKPKKNPMVCISTEQADASTSEVNRVINEVQNVEGNIEKYNGSSVITEDRSSSENSNFTRFTGKTILFHVL